MPSLPHRKNPATMADRPGQDVLAEGRPLTPDDQAYGDPEDASASQLLTLPLKKAAELNYKLWKNQPKGAISRRKAQWKVNRLRRAGVSNTFVQKTQDRDEWIAWTPPFNAPPIPVLNKADRLCRRLRGVMFSDPPRAEAIPASGDDEDIEAAEMSERILNDVQGTGQLDDLRRSMRAFDFASTYGSGFVRYYVDPSGGGRQPVRQMAKMGAVSADHPFTGPNGEPLEGEPVVRYAMADGTLVDDPGQAATRWVPALKAENLEPPSIRFLPHDAADLWDADGVIIATMPTWGELEKLWPEQMAALSKEDEEAVLGFTPVESDDGDDRAKNEGTTRKRDKKVAVYTTYYSACPAYPKGCYFVGLADKATLYRGPWVGQVDGVEEPLLIPLTQYGQFEAGRKEPFYIGLMELLGGGSETRAAQVGHLLQYLDQFARRRTFIPTNSIIQPKSYQQLEGSVIPVNPGGQPSYEEIPDYPPASMEAFTLITEEMDDHSMLKETAQGTEVPSVTSGIQAQVIVAQSKAGLTDIAQNTERAYLRACRIQLQLIRTHYTIPQQISWTGEDGQYRQQWWDGSDLGSTKDVKLKQGTLSMMTEAEKATMAMQFQQAGLYQQNPEQFYDSIAGGIGAKIGLQDDPFRQRIKRQLASWSNGPPEGFEPPAPPTDPATGQPQVDPTTGQPAPPPPAPELAVMFKSFPVDELQDVATVRLGELKRFMASTKFSRHPPEWQAGVLTEYDHMKLCAGVLTIPEQQAAAQAAQQHAEQQAQLTAQAKDGGGKAADSGPRRFVVQRGAQGELAAQEITGEAAKPKRRLRVVSRDATGRPAEIEEVTDEAPTAATNGAAPPVPQGA